MKGENINDMFMRDKSYLFVSI